MNIKKYKKCTTLNLIRLVHKIAKIKFFTLMDWYPIMAMGLVAVIKILLLVFVSSLRFVFFIDIFIKSNERYDILKALYKLENLF